MGRWSGPRVFLAQCGQHGVFSGAHGDFRADSRKLGWDGHHLCDWVEPVGGQHSWPEGRRRRPAPGPDHSVTNALSGP